MNKPNALFRAASPRGTPRAFRSTLPQTLRLGVAGLLLLALSLPSMAGGQGIDSFDIEPAPLPPPDALYAPAPQRIGPDRDAARRDSAPTSAAPPTSDSAPTRAAALEPAPRPRLAANWIPELIPLATRVVPVSYGEPALEEFHFDVPESEVIPRDWGFAPSASRSAAPYGPWARWDLTFNWMKGMSTPVLATSSPRSTSDMVAGVLGEPTTTELFGGTRIVNGFGTGANIEGGYWLGPTQGFQAAYTFIARDSTDFRVDSIGDPYLARPFFNVAPGDEGEDAQLVAIPNEFSGNITIRGSSTLQGWELLYRRRACPTPSLDWLIGWRHVRLKDALDVSDFRLALDGSNALSVGTTISQTDMFATENVFDGVTFGMKAERNYGNFGLEMLLKMGLGTNRYKVAVSGINTVSVPVPNAEPDVFVRESALLAQGTNIGVFEGDEFTVIPELGMKLRYQVRPRLRVSAGYTFFYWSRVARAGDQIDRQLNLTQLLPGGLDGPPRPVFPGHLSDVWAHGFTLGLDGHF